MALFEIPLHTQRTSQSKRGLSKYGGCQRDISLVMGKRNIDLVVALEHAALSDHRIEPLAEGQVAIDGISVIAHAARTEHRIKHRRFAGYCRLNTGVTQGSGQAVADGLTVGEDPLIGAGTT